MGNIINWISKSNKTNTVNLKIRITNTYTIKCSYIDANKKETIIQVIIIVILILNFLH